MGIQSRKNKASSKKNNITINVNIEEKPRPVKVVKQAKPVIVKQPKPVVVRQADSGLVDKLKNPDKVDELKNNATKFQTLRDTALKKGIKLPQNFSSIPDIRDRKDLSMANKTLLERIKILEDKLKNQIKPTPPILKPNSSSENQPVDYVRMSKDILNEMTVLADNENVTLIYKEQQIISNIMEIKRYINLDDNPENDEQMTNHIEQLDNILTNLKSGVEPIPDEDTPQDDLPEIVQYQQRLPDSVVNAMIAGDSIILNRVLREAVREQQISEATKLVIQKMRPNYLITKIEAGNGPTIDQLKELINFYIEPTQRVVLEPLTDNSKRLLTKLGQQWTQRSLLNTLVWKLLIDPTTSLETGTYKPSNQLLDERIEQLDQYKVNTGLFYQNNPTEFMINKLRILDELIDGSRRVIKASYIDDDEDDQKSIRDSYNILDSTGGEVAPAIAYELDNDGRDVNINTELSLRVDEGFKLNRPDLDSAYNLYINDNVVLTEEETGVEVPRLYNQNGTFYTFEEESPLPPEGREDDERGELRRLKIKELIKTLYYTDRGYDHQVQKIHDQLRDVYETPKGSTHILMYTDGDIALAKALLQSGMPYKQGDDISFRLENTNMPGASPKFTLTVNNQVATEGDTESPLFFTMYGDVYKGIDLKGNQPTLSFPFGEGSREGL
jgi:hypothetical protein